ncbi:hypothetical protein ACFRAU_03495 [Arthrobacter sp. NPDC056691]|uniref:hypothetical protein n=1 Tax=Arthrobacter sp. NPDC056691 TaxID=3345913 RepID=UPI00366DA2C8
MTKLEVRIRYAINDLWLDPGLLGWSRRVENDGESMEIKLPASPEEFTARPWESGLIPIPSFVHMHNVYEEPDWDSHTVAVRLVRVTVVFDADLPVERPENPFEGDYGTAMQMAYEHGRSQAEAAMHSFLEWVRALSRQPWLGLTADIPVQYGRGGIYYADSGADIAGIGPTVSQTFVSSRRRIGPSQLEAVMTGVESGQSVPPSQALLADAWHLTDGTDRPDRQRGVILAAIACEIKAQEHLRDMATEETAAILHLLLRKGSTLHYFLNDVLNVVRGMTLRRAEPDLWQHVQALSANRNSLVHEGIPSAVNPLRLSAPEIAQRVFDWLDHLRAEQGRP